jgi:regulator of sigma E protease
VRMLGDDPSAPVDPTIANDPEAFTSKPVWRRALIVAAGPIANFILPVCILFFGALLFDGQVVSTRLGTVLPEGPAAQAGLRTGDRIVTIDGVAVQTFDDLRHEIASRPGKKVRVEFERDGKAEAVALTPSVHRQVRVPELGLVDTVGRIEVRPDAQSSVVAVQPGGVAWQAGLRSGERVMAVGAVKTSRYYELEHALNAALTQGKPVTLQVEPLLLDAAVPRTGLQQAFEHAHAKQTRTVLLPAGAKDADALGLSAAQLVVGPIEQGSPADVQTGLRSGDEVLAVDGAPAHSFVHLFDILSKPYDDVRSDASNRGLPIDELVVKMRAALARPHALTVRHALRPAEVTHLQQLLAGQGKAETPLEKAVLAEADPQAVLARGWLDRQATLKLEVVVGKDDRPTLSFGA